MSEETVGARIVRLADAHPAFKGTTRKTLAKNFGVSYETLRKWISGESAPSRRRSELIASALNVLPEVFLHGVVYEIPSSFGERLMLLEDFTPNLGAQSVSQESVTFPPRSRPQTIEWRDREMLKAHTTFCVVVPDDSMAPIVLKGMRAEFDRSLEPRNEDTVLVEDGGGDWYIRTYLKAPQGRWQAKSERGSHVLLESERDDLKVLAVLTGAHGRRG